MLLTYLGRRLVLAVVALFGVVLTAFLVAHSVPADPLATVLSEQATKDPSIRAAYVKRWGLDRTLPEQFGAYLANVLRGDLGESFTTRRPVLQDLQAVPARHGGALADRPRGGRVLRRAAGSLGGDPSQPAARSRRSRRVAGRRRLADLLDRAHRALRLLLPPRVGAGARAPGQPPDDAASRHRVPPRGQPRRRELGALRGGGPAPDLARPRPGLVHHGHHRPHDAVVPARSARRRLRAHGPVEGARRGTRRGIPRAPERPDPGGHRHRLDLREPPVRRGADRDGLRLARASGATR